jgi:hypothetical protein
MSPRILVVSHDAGGASALAPVVARLRERWPTRVWLHPLSAAAIPNPNRIVESLGAEEALDGMLAEAPQVLLTGTSWGGATIDKMALAAARTTAVPSLGLLDSWVHYRERFTTRTDGDGALLHLPDRLLVMDREAEHEMAALGFPRARISAVGLTRLVSLPRQSDREPLRARLAASYGLDPAAKWIFFASQALSSLFGGPDGARARFGYSQEDALRGFACALLHGPGLGPGTYDFIVRYHPKEPAREPIPGTVIDLQQSPLDMVLAADLVIGMSGAVLLDAYALGQPVLSFQPGAVAVDEFILTRRGLVPRILDEDELAAAARAALATQPAVDPAFRPEAGARAVDRVVDLVAACARSPHEAA